ncbi:hypothetical protein GCM10027432_22130 [Lysobacter fragariae]
MPGSVARVPESTGRYAGIGREGSGTDWEVCRDRSRGFRNRLGGMPGSVRRVPESTGRYAGKGREGSGIDSEVCRDGSGGFWNRLGGMWASSFVAVIPAKAGIQRLAFNGLEVAGSPPSRG